MKLHKIDKWNITTTVGELVIELLKFDLKTLVFIEGCDCTGNVVGVALNDDGTVLIERDDRAIANDVVAEKYIDRIVQGDLT